MRIKKGTHKIFKIVSLCFLLIIVSRTSYNNHATQQGKQDGIGPGKKNITIATFNIYNWGLTKNDEKDYEKLANLIRDFDLIAIQGVMAPYGEERIHKLIEKMGGDYDYFYSPKTGTKNWSERYVFIFKEPVKFIKASGTFIIENPLNNKSYSRVPCMAHFRAKNFDFWLINVHLQRGSNKESRTKEARHFANWLKNFTPGDREKDFIVLGNFNRYSNGSKSFDEFYFKGWKNHYRILTLEPVPPLKTNCDKTVHYTYDNIFISRGTNYEFGEKKAKKGETIGAIPWDTSEEFKNKSVIDFRKIISDHRPVWAKFEILKPDDD